MVIRIQHIAFSLLIIVLAACVESYWPDYDSEKPLLIVDALVTNHPNYQYVKLSRSADLNMQLGEPETDAEVLVSDQKGNSYVFREDTPGKYYPSDFVPETGEWYSLYIKLSDGSEYTSPAQQMKPNEPFDTIYYQIEEEATSDPEYSISGARFYIQNSPRQDTTYCLIQIEETYQFHTDLKLYYVDSGSGFLTVENPPPRICWKTTVLDQTYLFKSTAGNEKKAQSTPLQFVPFNTRKMFERYSLLINQVNVSEKVFRYFYQVDEQNNSGSVHAIQPYNIQGNIESRLPENKVRGVFAVGGVFEQRQFFAPPETAHFTFQTCDAKTDNIGVLILMGGTPENPFYFTMIEGELGLGNKECFFCWANYASSEEPEFWNNN